MIEIRHISKKFRNRVAVDDVSLQMNTGIMVWLDQTGLEKQHSCVFLRQSFRWIREKYNWMEKL